MNSTELQLNHKAIAEANAVAAPFIKAKDEARIAYETAETDAMVAWQEAYANAMKAPRNQ
jgi:hypothetical protein